jgi:hypothetical protein
MISLSTMARDVGESLNVPLTLATTDVRRPADGKPLIKSQEIGFT